MKKFKKIIFGGIFALLILTYGLYFTKNQQQLEQVRFEKNEMNLIQKIEEEINQDAQKSKLTHTTLEHTEIFLALPLDDKNEIITEISNKMKTISKNLAKEQTQKIPTKIVIRTNVDTSLKNIKKFNYLHDTYTWNDRKELWEKKSQTNNQESLINVKTNQPLTLGDIFKNQTNLSTINRTIQETLLTASKESKKEIDAILNLPLLKVNSTNFDFFANKIVLHYPTNNAGISSYSIKYKDFGAYLNSDFIDEKYIVSSENEIFDPNRKVVALTFDDGPHDKTTPTVLNILKENKIHASFFMLGQQAEKFPKIVDQMAKDGHDLANHSYSHPNYTTLSEDGVREQINKTQSIIYKASGVLPRYARPPYGSFDYNTAIAIGLPIVNWSVDSLDWKSKDENKIIKQITDTNFNHSIILMHDIHEPTVNSLPKLIEQLKKEGYEFVTITELLQIQANPLTVYYSGENKKEIAP